MVYFYRFVCKFRICQIIYTENGEFYKKYLKLFFKRELREVLAQSIAPIARFKGPQFAKSVLIPVFQQYMRDAPEVQSALLQELANFCEVYILPYI